MNVQGDLDLKYEIENFIFAFIIIILIVYIFLVHFIRKSTNLLKRMDKLIELSEFGKYDIHTHLDKLGTFGEKVNYLLFHLSRLNDLKTLKISTSSNIIRILLKQITKKIYIFDRAGNLLDYGNLPFDGEQNSGQNTVFSDIFPGLNCEDIYMELDSIRKVIKLENIKVISEEGENGPVVEFYPVINAEGKLSNTVAVVL
jgi:hypothetical protein